MFVKPASTRPLFFVFVRHIPKATSYELRVMSLFARLKLRFSILGISNYTIENECFLFRKIKLATRGSRLAAFIVSCLIAAVVISLPLNLFRGAALWVRLRSYPLFRFAGETGTCPGNAGKGNCATGGRCNAPFCP